ncbi:hypothetical protein L596_029365 [Steinernema carpocapsae]|uniref:Cytochrome P450 n=1 Tax=Steinernema carpocapsae TaxID=34508 RepID=A0A4U5LUE7_STECR|nr:hypothetical protein L596_029365 [Steinernema carpocapsae]
MAVITETHRCTNLLNFNVLHKTACDTVMGDFIVPKGTTTTCQLSLILEDEADFVNPEQFSPDRYLENKKLAERVIPFSVGKRSCLGESLARAEMFLISANLIQNYKISVPEGQKPPRLGVITTETMLKRSDPFEMKIEKVH